MALPYYMPPMDGYYQNPGMSVNYMHQLGYNQSTYDMPYPYDSNQGMYYAQQFYPGYQSNVMAPQSTQPYVTAGAAYSHMARMPYNNMPYPSMVPPAAIPTQQARFQGTEPTVSYTSQLRSAAERVVNSDARSKSYATAVPEGSRYPQVPVGVVQGSGAYPGGIQANAASVSKASYAYGYGQGSGIVPQAHETRTQRANEAVRASGVVPANTTEAGYRYGQGSGTVPQVHEARSQHSNEAVRASGVVPANTTEAGYRYGQGSGTVPQVHEARSQHANEAVRASGVVPANTTEAGYEYGQGRGTVPQVHEARSQHANEAVQASGVVPADTTEAEEILVVDEPKVLQPAPTVSSVSHQQSKPVITSDVVIVRPSQQAPTRSSIIPSSDITNETEAPQPRKEPKVLSAFELKLAQDPSLGQRALFGDKYKPGPGQAYITKIREIVDAKVPTSVWKFVPNHKPEAAKPEATKPEAKAQTCHKRKAEPMNLAKKDNTGPQNQANPEMPNYVVNQCPCIEMKKRKIFGNSGSLDNPKLPRNDWYPKPASAKLDQLFIGPNKTCIPSQVYASIPWESLEESTKVLMEFIFDDQTLATHNLEGESSLDPAKVEDIAGLVADKCFVTEKLVRSYMVTICSDKAKEPQKS